MTEEHDVERILTSLARIEDKLGTLVKVSLRPIFESELSDPKMAKLYDLTGRKSASELTKTLSCSASTVSSTWQRWERMGLIVKEGNQYRKVL